MVEWFVRCNAAILKCPDRLLTLRKQFAIVEQSQFLVWYFFEILLDSMFVPWDCYYMATYSSTGFITIDLASDTDLLIIILYYSYRC